MCVSGFRGRVDGVSRNVSEDVGIVLSKRMY